MTRLLRRSTLVTAVIMALALATAATVFTATNGEKLLTAYFTRSPGLYAGDPVRVMGVDVGTVESVSFEPKRVKVVMRYDRAIDVPSEAKAAIVSPTMVSGRFVQLAPPYVGGPTLPEDATIPVSRTAVPVEWDSTVGELTRLAEQLGPEGGEVTGALGRAVDTASANLDGQGATIHETIRNASSAMSTLAEGGEDLFGTVRNLQSVVSNLAENDAAVEAFNQQLSQVSSVLADNRGQLATMVKRLDESASMIRDFVRDNRDQVSKNVAGLKDVAKQLADNRQALADLLQRSAVGVSNFNNIYDPVGSLMVGALATTQLTDPATFVCSLIFQAGGRNDNTNRSCELAITPFVQLLKMNNIPLLTNPLEIAPKDNGGGGG